MRATEFAHALLASWFEISAISQGTELAIIGVLHYGPCPGLWTDEQNQIIAIAVLKLGERYLPKALLETFQCLLCWTTTWLLLRWRFLGGQCNRWHQHYRKYDKPTHVIAP